MKTNLTWSLGSTKAKKLLWLCAGQDTFELPLSCFQFFLFYFDCQGDLLLVVHAFWNKKPISFWKASGSDLPGLNQLPSSCTFPSLLRQASPHVQTSSSLAHGFKNGSRPPKPGRRSSQDSPRPLLAFWSCAVALFSILLPRCTRDRSGGCQAASSRRTTPFEQKKHRLAPSSQEEARVVQEERFPWPLLQCPLAGRLISLLTFSNPLFLLLFQLLCPPDASCPWRQRCRGAAKMKTVSLKPPLSTFLFSGETSPFEAAGAGRSKSASLDGLFTLVDFSPRSEPPALLVDSFGLALLEELLADLFLFLLRLLSTFSLTSDLSRLLRLLTSGLSALAWLDVRLLLLRRGFEDCSSMVLSSPEGTPAKGLQMSTLRSSLRARTKDPAQKVASLLKEPWALMPKVKLLAQSRPHQTRLARARKTAPQGTVSHKQLSQSCMCKNHLVFSSLSTGALTHL